MGKGVPADDGYAKNSRAQAATVNYVLDALCGDALEKVRLSDDGPVVVADLGGGLGANSVNNLTYIVEKLRSRSNESSQPLEFQGLFNDLPSKDFNSLFQNLSTDSKDFFVAGVPGSCYSRLLPSSSVNVFFSSMSVHWLSKIPEAVLNKDSPAFNKGRFWITKSSSDVVAAFREQALLDMVSFLKARAAELVPGGLLFVIAGGRAPVDPSKYLDDPPTEAYYEHIEAAFSELLSEGVITEEQMDTLNCPMYNRTVDDLKEAVGKVAIDFEVHSLKTVDFPTSFVSMFRTVDHVELSKHIVGFFKSKLPNIVDAHIGKEASERYWQIYEKVVTEKLVPEVLARHDKGLPYDFRPFVMILMRK